MTQAVSRRLIKSYAEAANRPPEMMSVADFIELYHQRRIAFCQKHGDYTANPDYILMQSGEKPDDPAAYLGNIFAVAHDRVEQAEYSVSLVGDPLQKIVIVRDEPEQHL